MDQEIKIPDEFANDEKASRAYELGMKRGYSWGHKDGFQQGELKNGPWPLSQFNYRNGPK